MRDSSSPGEETPDDRRQAGRPASCFPGAPRPRRQAVVRGRRGQAEELRQLLPDAGLRFSGPDRGPESGVEETDARKVVLQLQVDRARSGEGARAADARGNREVQEGGVAM